MPNSSSYSSIVFILIMLFGPLYNGYLKKSQTVKHAVEYANAALMSTKRYPDINANFIE